MISSVNVQRLREIANSGPESKVIFTALKKRNRTRGVTDLRQFLYKLLEEGSKITMDDMLQNFKDLEKIEVGSLIIGRKGKPTRFKWNYSLKKIGRLGLSTGNPEKQFYSLRRIDGKNVITQPIEKKTKTKTNVKPSTKTLDLKKIKEKASKAIPPGLKSAIKSQKIRAYMLTEIPLRNDVRAKIEIPVDLTLAEAKKIHLVIKSLIQPEFDSSVDSSPEKIIESNQNEPESSDHVQDDQKAMGV